MPNLTTTIEDSSPVIIYSNGWEIGSSTSDDFVERYSESSYMRTNVTQASASFTFYGNGVQIFGAKRQNYSRYQVSIDSKVYPIRDASVSDPLGSFQTSLFSTIALAVGDHTVHLTNIDQKPLDLDFITWQTPVGQDSDTITVVTDQDTESSFDYSPSSQWSTDVPNPGMFSGGSGHVTYTAGATVRFTFKGSAVQLFGPVGPNCAPYSVSLDDGTPLNYSSYRPFYRPEQLLFQASNLGAQEHNIAVRSQTGTNSTVYFAVDYVQVFTPSSWDRSSGLSVAQIVGIVVGSVSGLILLVALVFLLRSKRGKYSLLRKKKDEVEHEQGPSLVIEPFSDFHSPLPVSPLYDTQAFTPRNSKGQLSNRTMVQSTKTTFSGENLYLQPENPSPMSSSSQRTPRILDEKRRLEPPLDTARESMPEMVQSPLPAVISVPTIEESPPVYLK